MQAEERVTLAALVQQGKTLREIAQEVGRSPSTLSRDQGQAYYEERYLQRVEINLRRKAESLGLHLMPMETA
jgi:IS30 family transposase